ncbi:hypothetical protein MKK69_04820 [Methylobacterium sp. J-026]|uniref:hypothetical protein n=1 Tax=Methylobacterium sp. J-026 TaxID=2836624 RepID=UPI001FBAF8E3|nr:hypothetical protein [Methylobacterium sp. J-026]MCJ2133390.1 hypothetical protein [Methylobacterium sp. J-026]
MTPVPPQQTDYENQLLVDVVFEKSRRVTPEMLSSFPSDASARRAVVLAQEMLGKPAAVRVLDFGGACGLHHRMARATGIAVKWAVVETPAMVRKAASAGLDPDLRYFDTIDAARRWLGGVDCVYSSSALQYVPDAKDTVARLLALRAPVVAWARLNLTDGVTHSFEQVSRLADNGPGPLPPGFEDCEIRYLCTQIAERDFLSWHTGYAMIEHLGPLDNATYVFRPVPERKTAGSRLWPFSRWFAGAR